MNIHSPSPSLSGHGRSLSITLRWPVLALTLAASLGAQAVGPPAQEPEPAVQLPEDVVTARKWEESPQDVPFSITALTERMLRDGDVRTVRDAARYVPNTLITEFASRRLSFPYVRGIGSGQGDPAVTTFIDGVPQLTVSSTNLPLLGVERVEFARGPSGALFGRNTLGGAIHVVSRRPAAAPSADALISIGNFRAQDYQLFVSAPLAGDELSFAVDAQHARRDGYTDNDFSGNDIDARDSWFGRGQILWTPNEANELRVLVYGEVAHDGGFVLSDVAGLRARPWRINQDFEGSVDRDLFAATVHYTHRGEGLDFTSITGVQDWEIRETADFDFSQIDGVRRFTDEEQEYISQELRVASPEDAPIRLSDDAELKWLAGVQGFYSDSERSAANEFRPGGAGILFAPANVGTDRAAGSFEDYAVGVFGQLTATLFDRLDLTAALRYDFESRDAEISRTFETGGFTVPTASTNRREDFDEFLPRASLAYRVNEDLTAYAVAARGFKAGGFNLTAPAGQEFFEPETSWSYEAGIKTSWFEDRLIANASVFYIDWDDMQLSQFNATSGGFVSNAGESTSHGVELEVRGRAVDGVEVFGGLGLLNTEFDRFTDQFGQDVSGRDLPFAPETTAHLGLQLNRELAEEISAFARAEYFHVGEFFFDASNLGRETYGLLNFRLGASGTGWRLEGWIQNTLDEDYVRVAFQANPADPTFFVGENAAPRTFGGTLRLDF
ncbi:MAG: TonB-dependent receptor [Planctomycetota bacterium]